MRGEEFIPASGRPVGQGSLSVEEIVFAGGLDHSVERDVLHDFELSYLSLRVLELEFVYRPSEPSDALFRMSSKRDCPSQRVIGRTRRLR